MSQGVGGVASLLGAQQITRAQEHMSQPRKKLFGSTDSIPFEYLGLELGVSWKPALGE